MDFVPSVSPHLQAPHHLAPLVAALESADHGPVRAVISVPPQHGKSVVCLHAIARRVRYWPDKLNIYATYGSEFAREQSMFCMGYAREAGARLHPRMQRLESWRTPEEGGLVAMGAGGPLTGRPGSGIVIVDDPIKNSAEAYSRVYQEKIWEWFNTTLTTRVHPNASIFVVQTRWTPNDLAGRLIKAGWDYICLPAINERGEALWEEQRPKSFLMDVKEQVGEYVWSAMYQGAPVAKDGAVFEEDKISFVDSLPTLGDHGPYRVIIGVDFAYTAKDSADYSAAVVLIETGGRLYVAEVVRMQTATHVFIDRLKQLADKYNRSRVVAYIAGSERVIGVMLQERGLSVELRKASTDKYSRAQSTSASWNHRKITLLANRPWTIPFLSEVCDFTGRSGARDDQVDALVAAHDALRGVPSKIEFTSARQSESRSLHKVI
jgi:predicted phage terminase large subunit-like protein